MWTVVENNCAMSGMVETAIFTAVLYWFFTSSRVADMLELVGERVGVWCGARSEEPSGAHALRRLAMQQRRKPKRIYAELDNERANRAAQLLRVKEAVVVPAPAPPLRPPIGLACSRCTPQSRESWCGAAPSDVASRAVDSTVINILDIGRQTYANGGVFSRYLCDIAHCYSLPSFHYPDVVPQVEKDKHYQDTIETRIQEEMEREGGVQQYAAVKARVEAAARQILSNISSAMSNTVLKLVAWVCHKAIRRVAGGGCGTRTASVQRLRRAASSGLPLIFVPLHRSHLDYILVTFTLYLTGIRPPLVAAGDNMKIPFFGWFLRGCGAFFIRRRVEGTEYNGDALYKSALRSYILNSLSEKNNLEFFIEGGRTRSGKPQLPKAGILSVIMDAYLDGTIEDALLVPVTLNYDRLVDGNFVREQLGMPKQMETFWSALKGIWSMLNTNHGGIRVDFNQPFSLKELVESFQKYNYLREPAASLAPPANNLASCLDRRILLNHSNSSLYGAGVSDDHKVMVEAIGRHLVYDAANSTAIMCTDAVAYCLLTELREGATEADLCARVDARGRDLAAAGRDLGYAGEVEHAVARALEMLGPKLVKKEVVAGVLLVRPILEVQAALELSYYANTLVAHYAPAAQVATALESLVRQDATPRATVRRSELMENSLQLCEILSEEFILCAPCQRLEDLLQETIDALVAKEILVVPQTSGVLEEERWSRRFARTLDEDDYDEDDDRESEAARDVTYTVGTSPDAVAERRRLLHSIRPLLEAYGATCSLPTDGETVTQREFVKRTIDNMSRGHAERAMHYGEAISSDAVRNCLRLLKQWGVVSIITDARERVIRVLPPYDSAQSMADVCRRVTKFNAATPLLSG